MRALRYGLIVASALLVCCGCSKGPKTFPVSGTIYLNDKPIEGVEVRFFTDKHAGFGKTDAQGHYELKAVAGDNGVIFIKATGKSSGKFGSQDLAQLEAAAAANKGNPQKLIKDELPAEYANAGKPKERFTVPSGGSKTADFHLKGAANTGAANKGAGK